MSRKEITLRYRVNERDVTVRAMDAVGVEDCYDVLMQSVMHRYVTGEDLTSPIPREVKDFLIRLNLEV